MQPVSQKLQTGPRAKFQALDAASPEQLLPAHVLTHLSDKQVHVVKPMPALKPVLVQMSQLKQQVVDKPGRSKGDRFPGHLSGLLEKPVCFASFQPGVKGIKLQLDIRTAILHEGNVVAQLKLV